MGGGMGMPYQMQMASQYSAMMQQYAQAQQMQMQDMMYRQQTVMGLQNEMYRIQSQIYQISMGGGYSGGMGPSMLPYPGPGYSTTPGYPTPYTPYTPYTPTGTTGTTTCPAGQVYSNGYCVGNSNAPRSSR